MMRPLLLLLLTGPGIAASALTGFPFADEALAYTIKGPGGVGLGEVHLAAKHAETGWKFDLDASAGIPGFSLRDVYASTTNSDFCGTSFSRQFQHGSHKGHEEETIERSLEMATRATVGGGGGKSEFPVPDCVKDALTLVYYARRELGQGRVPSPQQFLFGGLYDIRMTYAGAQTIQSGNQPALTDEIVCTVKGPASTVEFEMYFARDPARTPLLVKVPLALGTFSMELVH
jgi:hypothetical protein